MRVVEFLSVDPLYTEYPWYAPCQFAGNIPIQAIDLDGLEPLIPLLCLLGVMVDVGAGVGQVSTAAAGGVASCYRVDPNEQL